MEEKSQLMPKKCGHKNKHYELCKVYCVEVEGTFGAMVPTGCVSSHSGIYHAQPKSNDKAIRVLLSSIRDHVSMINLILIEGECNIADKSFWVRWAVNDYYYVGPIGIGDPWKITISYKAIGKLRRHKEGIRT